MRKSNDLIIDHVMFPVYHNLTFLQDVKKYWDKLKGGSLYSKKMSDRIFILRKHFYIEHISVSNKLPHSEQYWSNSICVEMDTKYWKYYKNPLIKDDNFLTPYAGCGYFLINPNSIYSHKNNKQTLSNIDGSTILISKKLKKTLKNLCGNKWNIPNFIKTDVHLLHNYDIVVIDKNKKLIAPYLQSNFPLLDGTKTEVLF